MTQNTTHTPGPWVTDGGTHVQSLYTPADGGMPFYHTVARVDQPLVTPESASANASLIADAPELLAALDYLLERTVDQDLKYGITLSEGEDDARAKAIAVIAKARGVSAELAA